MDRLIAGNRDGRIGKVEVVELVDGERFDLVPTVQLLKRKVGVWPKADSLTGNPLEASQHLGWRQRERVKPDSGGIM